MARHVVTPPPAPPPPAHRASRYWSAHGNRPAPTLAPARAPTLAPTPATATAPTPTPASTTNTPSNEHEPTTPPNSYTNTFQDTPHMRNQLAKYIFNEMHDSNLSMDNTPTALETARREIFGPVASDSLFGAGGANHSALTNATPLVAAPMPAIHRPYYGDVFESFQTVYWPIHCVICLVICTLGIFANLINVIVLTRPNMITAVNTILCAIACSDLIVNLSNIPYLMHELSDSADPAYYSSNWAHYILMHAHLTVTSHTISIWLTCALATWRYCVIRSQSSNKRNWSVALAVRVILGVVLLVPVFCIPNYLSFAIVRDIEKNSTIYKVGFSSLAEESQFIKTFHFWIFSCLTKLLPCLLLTYFTTVLIKLLSTARKRRLRLTNNLSRNSSGSALANSKGFTPNGFKPGRGRRASEDEHHAKRKLGAKAPANEPVQKGRVVRHKQSGDIRDNRRGLNNLQALAQNMRAHMDVQVIQEAELSASSHQKRDVAGKRMVETRGSEEYEQAARPSQDLDSSLELEPGAPAERRLDAESLMSLRDNMNDANNEQANNSNNNRNNNQGGNDDSSNTNNQSNTLAGHITGYSGSSCATYAECLQVTASLSSHSSASSGSPVDHQTGLQQHKQQQLLVETTSGIGGQAASSKTTTTTRALLNSRDRANLLSNNDKEQMDMRPLIGSAPRSSSTGGALNLYAINGDSGNPQSRVTLANLGREQDRFASSRTVQLGALDMPRGQVAAQCKKAGSGNDRHDSLKPICPRVCHSDEVGPDQVNRPRSIGSASFAPLQIVRFHATHRQLSQNETTTRLLIAVIIVFLICEFPAGILAALCAILGQDFFDNVYQPMGTLTDLLALINSSVNFILYCFMSTQFRITFYRVVLHCPAPREMNSTK